MKDFVGLVPPQSQRPRAAFFGPARSHNFIRDQLTISTWLSLGALAQGLALLILGRAALLPTIGLLLWRGLDTYLMAAGWRRNRLMDGILMKKFTAQFPNEIGEYGSKPADQDVVVFLLGTRCNHPLGLLAPGVKNLGAYFDRMTRDLETHADEFGFLGMTSWLNASTRTTASETMVVCYFRSVEGLHRFAHSDFHRKGWKWWNETVKDLPHLSIYHETYHVPRGCYETIYANSHISGLASATFKYMDKETGEDMWASPVVDASKGLLKTSAGRMARSDAKEHDTYEQATY